MNEYIQNYIQAKKDNNIKLMKQIERDLARLGMDKFTLDVLVAELSK